jgi:hypothetical protein
VSLAPQRIHDASPVRVIEYSTTVFVWSAQLDSTTLVVHPSHAHLVIVTVLDVMVHQLIVSHVNRIPNYQAVCVLHVEVGRVGMISQGQSVQPHAQMGRMDAKLVSQGSVILARLCSNCKMECVLHAYLGHSVLLVLLVVLHAIMNAIHALVEVLVTAKVVVPNS